MNLNRACFITIALAIMPAFAAASPATDLKKLFDDEWERGLRENPVNASYLGDRRYNDRWEELTLARIEQNHQAEAAALKRLAAIRRAGLPEAAQLNYDLFKDEYERSIESYGYRQFLIPLNQRGGVQTLDELTDILRFTTQKDYEDWAARLEKLGAYIDQHIPLMRQGMREGIVPPKVVFQRIPAQIDKLLVAQPEDSTFYRPFKTFPSDIAPAQQEALRARARKAIGEVVIPAYRRFGEFFKAEYLPACRESIAASSLPDGKAFYTFRARAYTTTDLTPEQIHQIGLSEVSRIRGEMEGIIRRTGFKGDFQKFLKFLRTDSRFYFKTGQELLDAYQALAKRIDPELVKLFRVMPRTPYGVKAVPDNIAPDTTTAYYQQPAADGSRAGYFYANLYKPESRPKYEMEALTLHEAVPGHHFQLALQQELGDLPDFRKYGGYTAFVEGWALYAESLGGELGLYADPYSKFGQLTYEMWRAIRLVVDTGMHYKGWTRQQAIDLFKDNTAKSDLDIVNEVDRYIAWPGQALAYKIGELKIKELRARATQKLGDKFDVRGFHDVVLGSGALPLNILERNVDAWVAQQHKTK